MAQNVDVTKNQAFKALFEQVSEHKIWEEIKNAGGNPNELFAQYAPFAFDVYTNDQNHVRARFVIRRFEEALQVLNNKENTGIIIGTFDSVPNDGNFNTKKPESAVLLKNNGEMLKISIFNHDLYTKPGIYNLNMSYNEQRESYIANSALEYKPITKNPIPALAKTAKTVAFDWESLNPSEYPTVVLKGKVSYVQAYPRFDGGAKVGDEPVYMENHRMNPVMVPVFQAVLDRENTLNRITVSFAPTNNGIPFIGDLDFAEVKSFDMMHVPESERINRVSRIFKDKSKEYVIIGTLTKIGAFDDKEGNTVNDIRIRGICMLKNDPNENPFLDGTEPVSTQASSSAVETLAEKVGVKKAPVETVEEAVVEEEEEVVVEQPVKKPVAKKSSSSTKPVETEDAGFF